MFVADFIGSPSMNLIPLSPAGLPRGANGVDHIGRADRHSRSCARMRRATSIVLGARPEHIRFDDASALSRRGIRRGISGHDADRDGQDRPRPGQGAGAGEPLSSRPANRSASASWSTELSLFDQRLGTGRAVGPARRRRRMADVTLNGLTKRFKSSRRSTTCRSTSPMASSSCCSGPTGAGKTTTLAPRRRPRKAR